MTGAGVVCARATVSDYYSGTDAARRFGQLSSLSLLAPMVAPALGALLLLVGDWRLMSALLAAIGVLQLAGVLLGVQVLLALLVSRRAPAARA